MASKAKKESNQSLKALQDYLKRDQHAARLLEAVARYNGELRQRCAMLTTSAEAADGLRKEIAALNVRSEAAIADADAARRVAESKLGQAMRDVDALRAKVAELESVMDGPVPLDEIPDELRREIRDVKKFLELSKKIRRRISTCPEPLGTCRGDVVTLFDIETIVRGHGNDDYLLLGQFVMLMSLLGAGVGFGASRELRKLIRKQLDVDMPDKWLKLRARLIFWLRKMIDWDTEWAKTEKDGSGKASNHMIQRLFRPNRGKSAASSQRVMDVNDRIGDA